MKYLIKVTKTDIENGIRYSCRCCPVALALQRHFGQKCLVGANGTILTLYLGLFNQPKSVKESIKKFINDFDLGKQVKSFSFEIEI